MATHNTCEETVEQRRSGLAVFLAAVLIALLAAASIGVLQQRSDRGRQGEILLAHLEGVTGALNALDGRPSAVARSRAASTAAP